MSHRQNNFRKVRTLKSHVQDIEITSYMGKPCSLHKLWNSCSVRPTIGIKDMLSPQLLSSCSWAMDFSPGVNNGKQFLIRLQGRGKGSVVVLDGWGERDIAWLTTAVLLHQFYLPIWDKRPNNAMNTLVDSSGWRAPWCLLPWFKLYLYCTPDSQPNLCTILHFCTDIKWAIKKKI